MSGSEVTRAVPRGVPSWQEDDKAKECSICHTKFSLFFRRHHCRKCGRVVCGNCSSSKSTYLSTTYVVSPPSQIFLESPHVPHRTCDECMMELEMIRAALRPRHSRTRRSTTSDLGPFADVRGGRFPGTQPGITTVGRPHRYSDSSSNSSSRVTTYDQTLIQNVSVDPDDKHRCPICGKYIEYLTEELKEKHIASCIEEAEFGNQEERNNRMIISKLPEDPTAALGECVICFEEFLPGNTVGRLECLCVYHEKCILDWFSRKGAGSCPVHVASQS
jgi:hypothetical protein